MQRWCHVASKFQELPSHYITLVARNPAALLFSWAAFPVLLTLLILLIYGLPEVETDLTSSGYLRADGPIADRFDALAQALALPKRSSSANRRLDTSFPLQMERKYSAPWSLKLYYKAEDAFDPAVIEAVRRFEHRVESLPSWHKFCLYSSRGNRPNTTCSRPISAMNFFYGREVASQEYLSDKSYQVYPDGSSSEQTDIQAMARAMGQSEIWNKFPNQSFPRTWYFDADFPKSKVMQTKYSMGVPLPGFRNKREQPDAQRALFRAFVQDELLPLLQSGLGSSKVTLNYEGPEITGHEIQQVLLGDAAKACASIFLVFLYMAIYTRACLVALLGMGTVILSIPFGSALFVALCSKKLPAINFLALFLLTGIGSDHLFMLMNSWRQTKREHFDDVSRLRLTFRRAGKSIAACGFTTALSFLINIFSDVRPLRHFGLFVGLCVLANLVLVLGMFPSVLLLRERTKQDKVREIVGKDQQPSNLMKVFSDISDAPACNAGNDSFVIEVPDADAFDSPAVGRSSAYVARPSALQENSDDEDIFDRIIPFSFSERFFGDRYAPRLYGCRWLSFLLGLLVTLSCLLLACVQFRPSQKAPVFLTPGSHNVADLAARRAAFDPMRPWTGDMERTPLRLCRGNCVSSSEAWQGGAPGRNWTGAMAGVASAASNTHGIDRTIPNSEAARIDVVFGLRGRPIQGDVSKLPSGSLSDMYDEHFDFGTAGGQDAVRRMCDEAMNQRERLAIRSAECFVDDLREFLQPSDFPYVPAEEIHSRTWDFIGIRRYEKQWENSIGFAADRQHLHRVRWVRLTFVIDVSQRSRPEDVAHWFEVWTQFIAEQNDFGAGTPGVGTMFHTSNLWVRFDFEKRLIGSAFFTIFLSVVFALLAVFLFLANAAVAAYTMFVNVCTVVCLAGILFGILGWEFGTVEAVGLIVAVGLSLDYSLHLSEAYLQADGSSQYERVQDALRRTGSSLVGAAGTSMISCPPILLCSIQVFAQFGSVIIISMMLSLIFSLVFFAAMLFIMGPVDGSTSVCAMAARFVWANKANAPVACQTPSAGAATASGGASAPSDGVQVSPLRKLCTEGSTSDASASQPVAFEHPGRGQ